MLARALFRRVRTAYPHFVLAAGGGHWRTPAEGPGLRRSDFPQRPLGVLTLGRRAFYRPTSIREERFTPIWAVSVAGVIVAAIWCSSLAYRHVRVFRRAGGRLRSMRVRRGVTCVRRWSCVLLATAYLLWNLLQPARPEPAVAEAADLERARQDHQPVRSHYRAIPLR